MSKRVWVVPGHVLDRPVDAAGDDVWAARVAGSIDQVALRIIPVHGEDAIEAGRRAALALIELDHPHLLALHEVITLRDAVVVSSDLMHGGSLDDMLRARGQLSPREVAAVLAPIAAALAYVHERGIVHGDVAPRRVLFSTAGLPVLSGLGVARIAGADAPNASAPAYIDPSVACGVFPSPSSDVFMLGAVAFHAVTGTPLWPGTAQDARSAAIAAPLDRSLDRVAERLAHAGVVPELAALVSASLALDAHTRPTAAQFTSSLAAMEPAMPPAVPPVSAAAAAPPMPPLPMAPPMPMVPLPPQPLRPAVEPDLAGWGYEAPSLLPPPPIQPPAPQPEPIVTEPAERWPAAAQWIGPAIEPEPGEPPAYVEPIQPFEPVVYPRRGRHSVRRRRRSPWLFAAIVAVALGAGATVWAVTSGNGSDNRPAAAATTSTATSELPSGSGLPFNPATGNITPSNAPTEDFIDAAAATQILNALDSIRQRAFASRAPILLTGVWASGRLLADDQALLEYAIPVGCGLQGAHTTYADVQVLDQSSVSLQVLTRTSVSAAVLVCHDKIAGQSPASPPVKNRITLIKRGPGWVISEIAAVATPTATVTS